jgi:hypothetical protein
LCRCLALTPFTSSSMKKKIKKTEEAIRPAEDQPAEGILDTKADEDLSIEEFIKIRKLQNQILEKMLDKLNHPDQKNNLKK